MARLESLPPPPGATSFPDGGEVGPIRSGWRLALREFMRSRLAILGLATLVFFVLFCFAGPLVYHGNLTSTNLAGFAGVVLGALWGAVSGLAGGALDAVMMRIVDVFLSIPFLFVILIVAVRYGASVPSLILIIGAFTWAVPARLVRGEVLTLRVRDFISAARTAGSGRVRLIIRHLIPNTLGVVMVTATFNVANAILAVATLGFLGFGLHFPQFDWGDMLSNGVGFLQDGYWWLVYPVGACIVLVVMACNLIGDALRDSLDVRLRRR